MAGEVPSGFFAFGEVRTARMTRAASRTRYWGADSRPRPVLAPVTTMVSPERSNEAGVGGILIWPMVTETRRYAAKMRREMSIVKKTVNL